MSSYESLDDLKSRVEDAQKYVADCVSCSEMCIWLGAESTRREFSKAWKAFKPVLDVVTGCVFDGLILSLYKPLEPKSETGESEPVNLWKILELAGRLKVINRTTQKLLKQKLRMVDATWQKIKHIRHNIVAHGKAGLSIPEELKQAGLTSSQWKRLISVYDDILNSIAKKAGVQSVDIEVRRRKFAEQMESLLETLDAAS